METFDVSVALSGCNDEGSRHRVRNEFLDSGGTVLARVDSLLGWMDLATRRLVVPPPQVCDALGSLARTPDFAAISRRGAPALTGGTAVRTA